MYISDKTADQMYISFSWSCKIFSRFENPNNWQQSYLKLLLEININPAHMCSICVAGKWMQTICLADVLIFHRLVFTLVHLKTTSKQIQEFVPLFSSSFLFNWRKICVSYHVGSDASIVLWSFQCAYIILHQTNNLFIQERQGFVSSQARHPIPFRTACEWRTAYGAFPYQFLL